MLLVSDNLLNAADSPFPDFAASQAAPPGYAMGRGRSAIAQPALRQVPFFLSS